MNEHRDRFECLLDASPVCIEPAQASPLSPAQQAFNQLISQLEIQRAKLADWAITRSSFRQKYQLELWPLISQQQALKIQIIHQLDAAYDQKGLNKNERRALVDFIVYLAEPILAECEDDGLSQLVRKYAPPPPDDACQPRSGDEPDEVALESMQALFVEMTGLDVSEVAALRDPEDILRHIEAHLAADEARREAERAAWHAKRKKSAKQLEKEAQSQTEAAQINQSIREVYRKLASALHPDREPDPIRRQKKTESMQRANQAYENNNLFKLLELQIELELIDQPALAALSDDRLQRYILALKAELKNLTAEVKQSALSFHHDYGIDPIERLTPATALRFLSREIQSAQQQIRELEREVQHLGDVTGVKAWLRAMR
jgi:flagellar biosynthesis GTPase FlhF